VVLEKWAQILFALRVYKTPKLIYEMAQSAVKAAWTNWKVFSDLDSKRYSCHISIKIKIQDLRNTSKQNKITRSALWKIL
jgi:hypothetical protein